MKTLKQCALKDCGEPGPFKAASAGTARCHEKTEPLCRKHWQLFDRNAIARSQQEEIKRAKRARDWARFLANHDRPDRARALARIERRIDDKTYWHLVSETWTDTEFPHQQKRLWRNLLGANRPGRIAMMTPKERMALALLPGRVRAYRGCGPNGKLGFSWTLKKKKAEFFAKRFSGINGRGAVISGSCNRRDILALFQGRNEDEVLVFPEKVAVLHESCNL